MTKETSSRGRAQGHDVFRMIVICTVLLGIVTFVTPVHPTEARDSGSVMVFTALVEGQWDLFAWNPRGEAVPRRLTDTPIDELRPSLSWDRRSVVYQNSAGEIWMLDLESGEKVEITANAEQNLYMQPAVSPSGETALFAFLQDTATDDTDLAVRTIRPQASEIRSEPAGPAFGPAWAQLPEATHETHVLGMVSSQYMPAWAPDGSRIAFTNLHCRATPQIIAEIWEARIDHSYARQLTLTDALCEDPAWAPDGAEIAFCSDLAGQYDIYMVDVATRQIQRLTTHEASDTDPVYAPGGQRLAFVSTRSGQFAIWTLDLRTGDKTELRPFGNDGRACKDPDWR